VRNYIDYTGSLRYYFRKWFARLPIGVISPYYLRHNRFSKLSEEGLTDTELRFLKGSRSNESIVPYQHLSLNKSRKLAARVK
jgi:hypothetical protein